MLAAMIEGDGAEAIVLNNRVVVFLAPPSLAFMSSISLFDGLPITEIDGLPASASRLL